jgi:hypothetical protein
MGIGQDFFFRALSDMQEVQSNTSFKYSCNTEGSNGVIRLVLEETLALHTTLRVHIYAYICNIATRISRNQVHTLPTN